VLIDILKCTKHKKVITLELNAFEGKKWNIGIVFILTKLIYIDWHYVCVYLSVTHDRLLYVYIYEEKRGDTKGVIRNRISKKDRQYNGEQEVQNDKQQSTKHYTEH